MLALLGFLWWLLIVFLWIMFLALTMTIARSKGHNPVLWMVLALFLPLISFLIVLVLPDRSSA
jgi:phosphate starvation-inducible membrane PsiE